MSSIKLIQDSGCRLYLVKTLMKFRVSQKEIISCLCEQLLGCERRLCSMELGSYMGLPVRMFRFRKYLTVC
jgi:hypothetical protein